VAGSTCSKVCGACSTAATCSPPLHGGGQGFDFPAVHHPSTRGRRSPTSRRSGFEERGRDATRGVGRDRFTEQHASQHERSGHLCPFAYASDDTFVGTITLFVDDYGQAPMMELELRGRLVWGGPTLVGNASGMRRSGQWGRVDMDRGRSPLAHVRHFTGPLARLESHPRLRRRQVPPHEGRRSPRQGTPACRGLCMVVAANHGGPT